MDPDEWAALEDAHLVKDATARLERYQLSGARKQNGQPFTLADLLPARLAVNYMPPQMPEDEVMARLRLCGFDYTEAPPAASPQ
jgi:hypothetical protein